jgi:energy-converting hydrogenase Eha subunit H
MFMKAKTSAPKPKRTTVSVTEQRRMKLERIAIETTMATGAVVKWTDVINYMIDMIDNYSDDAKKDMAGK